MDTKGKPTAGKSMPKVLTLVSFVSFVVIAAFVFKWWTNPERLIRNQLHGLAAALSIPAKGGDLSRVARLAQLRRYFADDMHVRWGGAEIASRDALMGILSGWSPAPGGWTVEFVDLNVTVGPDATTAQVHLTARISGRDPRTGEPTIDAREATVKMGKRNGDWVLTDAEATETLQK